MPLFHPKTNLENSCVDSSLLINIELLHRYDIINLANTVSYSFYKFTVLIFTSHVFGLIRVEKLL